uniref:MINDY deubiquitinase domain-containing protein n=1 Tax=Leersia perrieri TaxID=77586 RepID=A0A0D9WLW7_9ORYZ
MERCKKDPELSYLDFNADRTKVIPIIKSMPTNIGLDVGLDSPTNFSLTASRTLFLYLNVNLVHGLLVDPEKEEKVYDAVGAEFVSDLVPKINQCGPMRDFFASTIKTQLTSHGLACLRMELQDGNIGLLYTAGHYRCRGVLFEQLRDINEYLKYPEAAWKSLEMGLGEGIDDKTTKQSIHDVKNSGNNQETGREENGSNLAEPAPSSVAENDDLEVISKDFADFLQNFKIGDGAGNYSEAMVAFMRVLGSPEMHIPYDFIRRHNKSMAIYIQDHHERIHETLRKLVAEYLIAHDLHIARKLDQSDSFEGFILDNKICCGDLTTYVGRKMSSRSLKYILDWFEEGKCWGGDWSASDMEVRNNGEEFVITKPPELDLDKECAYADLKRYIEVVLDRFKTESGHHPLYFEDFIDDVIGIPDPSADPTKWRGFLKLLRNHFALKAPLVRLAFLSNVFRVADSMRVGMAPNAPAFSPFNNRAGLKDWRFNARQQNPLRRVYMYKNFRMDKWENSYWFLLLFTRHSIEHVLNYTKKDDLHQQIRDIAIMDLILARHLGKYIAQFVRFFVYSCDFPAPGNILRHLKIGIEHGAPLPSTSHVSVIYCDLSLAAIEEALNRDGVEVQQLDGALCCGGNITVREARNSIQEGNTVSGHKSFSVEGPYGDDYARVLDIVAFTFRG